MTELIKTLFMIVGGIATVVTLYKLYHGRLKIRAKGTFSRPMAPPNAAQGLHKFRDALRNAARSEEYDAEAKTKRLKDLLAEWPVDVFEDYGTSLFVRPYCWRFEISNVGKAEVKDLMLELPFNGVCVIDDGESADFKKRISLGALRSRGTIDVTVWTAEYSAPWGASEMHITHSGGSVPVAGGRTIYGKAGALAEFVQKNWGFSVVLSISALCMMMELGILTSRALQQTRSKADAVNPPSAPTQPASPATSRSN